MDRSALDLQLPAQIEGMLAEAMTADEIAEVAGLLHALGEHDFAALPVDGRTEIVHGMRAADAEAKLGLDSAAGAHAAALLRAARRRTGSNPNWEAIGYPGPVSAAPSAEQAPEDDRAGGGQRRRGHAQRGRVRGRLRRRRLGDRRTAGRRRQVGAGARDGRLPQRVGLQPARDPGLPGALLRRRPGHLRGRVDLDPGRLHAGRRHRRELHELHPHAGADRQPSGPGTGWRAWTTPRPTSATTSTR